MSESNYGKITLGWWSQCLAPRDQPAARALAARLRRASAVETLCESEVIALARQLDLGPQSADRLAGLVALLAEVREHSTITLAKALGGTEPSLSKLRFQRVMRAEGAELIGLLRRAVQMADHKCNIAALASDLIYWGPNVRARWCFDYFGADATQLDLQETVE